MMQSRVDLIICKSNAKPVEQIEAAKNVRRMSED